MKSREDLVQMLLAYTSYICILSSSVVDNELLIKNKKRFYDTPCKKSKHFITVQSRMDVLHITPESMLQSKIKVKLYL